MNQQPIVTALKAELARRSAIFDGNPPDDDESEKSSTQNKEVKP